MIFSVSSGLLQNKGECTQQPKPSHSKKLRAARLGRQLVELSDTEIIRMGEITRLSERLLTALRDKDKNARGQKLYMEWNIARVVTAATAKAAVR